MEWISVDIGKPNDKVMVRLKAGNMEFNGYRDGPRYLMDKLDYMLLIDEPITHWKPLPE